MNRRRRTLLIVFGLSWILLFSWSFRSVRLWTHEAILWKLGLSLPPSKNRPREFMPLHLFQPRTELQSTSRNLIVKPLFRTFEIHGHIFRKVPKNMEAAMDNSGIEYFINLSGQTVKLTQFEKLKKKYPSPRIIHFVGFNWKRTGESKNFGTLMAADLEAMARAGARGIKIWKNFGLEERDINGELLRLDDKRLDPVWDVCAKYRLPIAIHIADPPAFFRPIDYKNERFQELGRKPEWSFHRPGLPSYQELLQQRDNLFRHRRDVRFIAVHFAEMAHDLKRAERFLKEHSNAYLDIAQRIDELGRQPRATRRFMIRHADRILFGTDGLPDRAKSLIYWRFLETDDEYFDYHAANKSRKGFWKIYGLKLPRNVLRKIYRTNAMHLLGLNSQSSRTGSFASQK